MRLRRIDKGRATFDDYAECVRHFAVLGRFDDMAAFVVSVSRYVGQLGTAELCAYARTLLPEDHRLWGGFLDLEVTAATAAGQPHRAKVLAERLHALIAAQAAARPDDLALQVNLAVTYSKLGDLAVAARDAAAARDWYTQRLAIARRLVQADPGNVQFQRDLSVSYGRLAMLSATSDPTEARRLIARDIVRRLAEIDPSNATYARDLAHCESWLAVLDAGGTAQKS
jgi:hypothetical protein